MPAATLREGAPRHRMPEPGLEGRVEDGFARQLPTLTALDGTRPAPWMHPLVMATCGADHVVGFAESVTDSEVVVQVLEELPAFSGDCVAVLDFGAEAAEISGAISSFDSHDRLVRISVDRIDRGGELLLGSTVCPGD